MAAEIATQEDTKWIFALSVSKAFFVFALLISIPCLWKLERVPSFDWMTKAGLLFPLIFLGTAGAHVWKDSRHAEIKRRTAEAVLGSTAFVLSNIYLLILQITSTH